MVLLYNKNTGGEQIEKTDVYYISYCFGYYFSGCFVLYVVCSYSILSISSWFRWNKKWNCETNQYEYDDYFSEYRGKETYYIARVKISGVTSYVAYNKDLALVDTYQGSVADSKDVQQAIEQKYQIVIDDLEVGYENERFVYYGRYQEDESLLYVYYDLMSGEFIKAVRLG